MKDGMKEYFDKIYELYRKKYNSDIPTIKLTGKGNVPNISDERIGCCDPAPQIKVIALLDTNCYTDIGFYLVCQTKPIDDKIFKMEKKFAQVREIICNWDV